MKLLDLAPILKSFEGQPIQNVDRPLTLRDVLLAYLSQAQVADLPAIENGVAYEAGLLIGTAKEDMVKLETRFHDVIKKLCDSPALGKQLGFSLVVTQQVKQLVDAAPEEAKPEEA